MKLAITADWLPTLGGAEQVIAALHNLWPQAPIFTTVAAHSGLGSLQSADIRVDRKLQRLYKIFGTHRSLISWMPQAMERINLDAYDVVISSSHAIGKGVIPSSRAVHICYCHTPMRYAWEMEDQYLSDFKVPTKLKPFVKNLLRRLRRWDLTTAQRVDVFIANSRTTQERIRRIYGRDAIVIHPPVQDQFFSDELNDLSAETKPYYLALGRLVPYKNFDLLIDMANTRHLPLKIAGSGPLLNALKKRAGPTVEMLGHVPDAELPSLYANARAFLFPPLEDAGVVPLEAQASGTPVIAYGAGGALDTVIDGRTGLFFPKQTIVAVSTAIDRFEKMSFDRQAIRTHARQFAESRFKERMTAVVSEATSKFLRSEVTSVHA